MRRAGVVAAAALSWAACGEQAPQVAVSVSLAPAEAFVTSLGATVHFQATARGADGAVLPGVALHWTSSDPSVATIDAGTGIATTVGVGITTVSAAAAAASGQAMLEVYVRPDVAYAAGQAYFGRGQYVEYLAGDLPVVVSAPHGGYEQPDEIPDRTWGTTARDRETQEMAHAVRAALHDRFGGWPHVVISRLHRVKLDPNREIEEAAQGNPYAAWAWEEFHGFLEDAGGAVAQQHGSGLYVDLHGHGHAIARLELGYLLSSTQLELSDVELEQVDYATSSSIRTLADDCDSSFAALLRGPSSLGGLLEARGYPAVPSPAAPDPGGAEYFSGGYDVRRHGSRDGGPVSGVQLEMHYDGVRDTDSARAAFAEALAETLDVYFALHFGMPLAAPRGAAAGAAPE